MLATWMTGRPFAALAAGGLSALVLVGAASAQGASPDAGRAPLEQYAMASREAEAALARSAAPASISDDAEVMVMGAHGYETVAKGTNGFVCMVQRSWGAGLEDEVFWNVKIRGPICFNPASVRSVLPTYLRRTQWVLAGDSRARMIEKTKAAIAAGEIRPPEAGAMCFMMSKAGKIGDGEGAWRPHLMFYLPHEAGGAAAWGGGKKGSPVMGGDPDLDPAVTYMVVVPYWSDGSPAPMAGMRM